MPALRITAACLFLIAPGNGVYWAFAKRSGQTDAQQPAFWEGVVRYTIAIVYLLLSERQRLWMLFVKERPSVSATSLRPFLKNLLRVSAFLIPLSLLWRYDSLHPKPVLTGKYAASHWVVNGHERISRGDQAGWDWRRLADRWGNG